MRRNRRFRPQVEVLEGRVLPSNFNSVSSFATGSGPVAVAVAQEHGIPEIATANYAANSVSVLISDGHGGFHAAVNYPVGPHPTSILAGEFTNYGTDDLVVAVSGGLSMLVGNGDGTFRPAVTTPTPISYTFLTSYIPAVQYMGEVPPPPPPASFRTLVALSQPAGVVSFLVSNSDGTFGLIANNSAGVNPIAVVALNRSGFITPLAVADQGDASGNGRGLTIVNGPTGTSTHVDIPGGGVPTGLATGDFGLSDLAIATNAGLNGSITILLANANGTFRPGPIYPVGSMVRSVVAADLSGDGKTDLAVAAGNSLGILAGNGDGTFQAVANQVVGPDPTGLVFAYFNGYGVPGLAAVERESNSVSVLLTVPPLVATGADFGGGPDVRLYNSAGDLVTEFAAYDAHFLGGVRVALGDFNGDGYPDVVTAPGPTGGPDIRIFDGKTGTLMREFMAYDTGFTGGVFVAVGDVNGDGVPDIITGAGAGGGPHVKVFSGKDGSLLASFYAYNPGFTGGVRVAAGDVNGDGYADIITGAGPGGGPHVEVFNGTSHNLMASFYAFDPSFTGGIYVAAGDTTGDGKADVIVGAGASAPPQVEVYSGASGFLTQSFLAFGSSFTGGVWVGTIGLSRLVGLGPPDNIIVGSGPGGPPQVEVIDSVEPQIVLDSFYAYDSHFRGGVFVGGV